jgi:hypothetical protein
VENPVDIKTFKEVSGAFLEYILKLVVDDAKEVELPKRTGIMAINWIKRKPVYEDGKIKNLIIDQHRTKIARQTDPKKVIYFTNEHTDMKTYHFYWRRVGIMRKNKTFYCFDIVRSIKRTRMKNNILNGTEYQECKRYL